MGGVPTQGGARTLHVCRMNSLLRALSLSIEELAPGRFGWIILEEEEGGTAMVEVEASPIDFESWDEALDAGVQAMKELADDRKTGPRIAADEDEDADPVGDGTVN